MILDRPRHQDLIGECRAAGARIKLIGDGDVAAAIATAKEGTDVNVLMGVGGAPEGVITSYSIHYTKLYDEFFRRIVEFAKENELLVIHDLAYADITFDGYQPPSFLEAPGAKSYNFV